MVGVEVHILRRAVQGVAVLAHRVQPDFVKIDAALSDIAFHLVPQNLICREQVHRRHEPGVCFVLLPDGFLECGLVLLAFESHLVITLLQFLLANKKSRLSFCRTLIRRPSSKQSALLLLYKKVRRFSTCTLD